MNAPTARFLSICAALGFTDDAMEMAFALVTASGINNFGRDRRKAGIKEVAPEFAAWLEKVGCDVLYVGSDNPLRDYTAVLREFKKAQQQHSPTPLWLSRLPGSACDGKHNWRKDGQYEKMPAWLAEVVSIARHFACDAVDQNVAVIAPRNTREAIYQISQEEGQ